MIKYRRLFNPHTNDDAYLTLEITDNLLVLNFFTVSYPKNDDNSTTTTNDTSGNDNHSTIDNSTPQEYMPVLQWSKSIDLSMLLPQRVYSCYSLLDEEGISSPMLIPVSRDGMYMHKELYRFKSEEPLIIVYSTGESYLVLVPSTPIVINTDKGDEYSEYSKGSTSEVIIDYDPKFEDRVKILRAQRKNLYNLDPNNSLSGIESQLDMLTLIVLLFMQQFPSEFDSLRVKFPEISRFIDIYNQVNVLLLKPLPEALVTMQEEKQLVRSSLHDYYETTITE